MEFTSPLNNLRTQICLILTGFHYTQPTNHNLEREFIWTDAAEDFLKRLIKLGIHITIIGPRPPKKFGSKKLVRFMDRHEVVGIKVLEASKTQRLEFRILNPKTNVWTRLRSEACISYGPAGIWPETYPGWTLPGTMSLSSLARWVGEFKILPGEDYLFIGSSNATIRWATAVLERGAKNCYVIEKSSQLQCWRSHKDYFISKGGRVLIEHKIIKVERTQNHKIEAYLANDQGTMIVPIDNVILSPINEIALNNQFQWKKGMFYIQKRTLHLDQNTLTNDEELHLETNDWNELYWRICKLLKLAEHTEIENNLILSKQRRRELISYRSQNDSTTIKEFKYSGKILDRESIVTLQSSISTPNSFNHPVPKASLECLEKIPCTACIDSCPENAIEKIKLTDLPRILEDKCTGCGSCVAICPSRAAIMIKESSETQKARYFFSDDSKELWRSGQAAHITNRKGEPLSLGRIIGSRSYENKPHRVIEIEATNIHTWEARGFKTPAALSKSNALNASEQTSNSNYLSGSFKRGWITLNGVKRLSLIDIPLNIALWKLGKRRFEDALFCYDGGCKLCEVTVNGKKTLACKFKTTEGISIEIADHLKEQISEPKTEKTNPLCFCNQIEKKEFESLLHEGIAEDLACEISGLGLGRCHGRWCLHNEALSKESRPNFHGYNHSPWRDITQNDVLGIDCNGSSLNNENEE